MLALLPLSLPHVLGSTADNRDFGLCCSYEGQHAWLNFKTEKGLNVKKKRSFELGNKIQTCFVLPQLALLDWLILGAHFATGPGGAGHLLGTELGRPSIGHCWGAQSRAQIDQSTMLETEQNTDVVCLT